MPRPNIASSNRPQVKNLSDNDRALFVSALLHKASAGILRRGALSAVAEAFLVSPQTVRRVWRRAVANYERTGVYSSLPRMGSTGHPQADRSRQLERLRAVDPINRDTVRAAAQACFLPPTTLFRKLRSGNLCVETSVAKPMLSETNKQHRVAFSVAHVDAQTHLFSAMEDVVHVDEKLFYLSKVKRRYILLPDEPKSSHRLKSKRHIPKVMILAAVARPRHDPVTGRFFDGKIGVWAFLTHQPAKRSSRNRPVGTMVPCAVSVSKTSYRKMLIEKVLPAIQEKFPGANEGMRIVVQQDNASPRIPPDDAAWTQAVVASGCNVRLNFQPPNSPDMNVLDLAVFNALQVRQQRMVARTLDELVANAKVAFNELPPEALNAGFLTLQCVMDDCVAADGDNTFKIRHMSKSKLAREGRLPLSIKCSAIPASFLPALVVLEQAA
ncbi:unnamed protein product [Phytophthora fragariaefolia]|uniref:Unnamed protein product n=1 Tax=Phytophthora fragariaefolia TaxID=1490495 RepID=A0A9W7D079_9STRA|nr:unnamed protein product [Phytophthora fragariaefolia]